MIVPIKGRNKRSSFGFLCNIHNNIAVKYMQKKTNNGNGPKLRTKPKVNA